MTVYDDMLNDNNDCLSPVEYKSAQKLLNRVS